MSTDRLRELHDEYAWEVNAAIEEGREDLVWRLVDDYVDAAMREMAGEDGSGGGRPGGTRCGRPPVGGRPAAAPPPPPMVPVRLLRQQRRPLTVHLFEFLR